MKKHKFTINSELPSMNEIIAAINSHRMKYNNMKNNYTALVRYSAGALPKIDKADFYITWYCKNRMKDPDNISGGGMKFLLDGLVEAGKIKNDGWKEIASISHKFEVDKKKPRVEVIIHEIQ